MLSLALIKNCNSCVYLIFILSNKLDLNQETHFTIIIVMFMCCTKRFSVIKLIYSGHDFFSYNMMTPYLA